MAEPQSVHVRAFNFDRDCHCEDQNALRFKFALSRTLNEEQRQYLHNKVKAFGIPARSKWAVSEDHVMYDAFPQDAQKLSDQIDDVLRSMASDLAGRRDLELQREQERKDARQRVLDAGDAAVSKQRKRE